MKYFFISIGVLGLLISCKQTKNTEIQQADFLNNKHYISIDGLWRCTPETASQFPNGTLEFIIQINGDVDGKITVRGCFLWEGRFYDYWDFVHVQHIDSTRQLVLIDDDGGTYKGIVDQTKESIQGFAIGDDEDATEPMKLDFIRDPDIDIARFFISYPAGPAGTFAYTYHTPGVYDDQLQTASIFNYIQDSTTFYNLMERIIKQEFGRLESLIIIKDEKLVLEEYFYGYDRTQPHNIHSCTKSIVSLLLGISLDRHNKLDVNQPVFSFFPQYDSLKTPEKEKITLKHVLTMTSGLPEDDDFEKHDPDDLVIQMLIQPLESTPGEKFNYNNNGTNLLGSIIYTLEKKQADEFASEVLFNKLGISEFYWEKENGVLSCHSDLHMLPRDMAQIGLLVLNNGSWNGEQIVPEQWIDISTKAQVAESEFFDYGYQWWYRSKRNKPWWEGPVHGGTNEHNMFTALGYGGQFMMIVRDLNMIIVTTSSDYNESTGMWLAKVPMVIEEVVPLFD